MAWKKPDEGHEGQGALETWLFVLANWKFDQCKLVYDVEVHRMQVSLQGLEFLGFLLHLYLCIHMCVFE